MWTGSPGQVKDTEQEKKKKELAAFELVRVLLYQSDHRSHILGGGGGGSHENHRSGLDRSRVGGGDALVAQRKKIASENKGDILKTRESFQISIMI